MLDGVGKLSPYGGFAGTVGAGQIAQPTPVVGTPNTVKTETLPTDFGTLLGQMTLDAITTLKSGEQTAVAGVRGQATTQQVVEAVMAAEQTLQAGIAIRDKVVAAYLEISRMTI
ncbi:MAG: flagellar hook-basal body complex protein FliE [Hyphomicrobium zavarzinii]|jgi:flagellar hook-basal body complex protein FliE|uniref:flagellar hook-basal body complex protein FliE n=1 Tax=Hyphomicrobium zavarzinii TaxID=48292 RepID=UPI001A50900C|nr:flagellar hook-basal body complex protein FliE [Hyphomicrobium zavarzinii]MBL8847771.1 flagellar hook-basal body complex protein FliE [Hyphomicrobium zavarzinii]